MRRVSAIIISYRPKLDELTRLLDAVVRQVNDVIVVDNGSGPNFRNWAEGRGEHYIFLEDNLGIGEAQNRGIVHAREQGATHVILFDHDSAPEPDMVERELACMDRLMSEGHRVASVGPCYLDDRQENPPPFVRVRGLKLTRCTTPETGDAVTVDYLIASGCLMPMSVIDDIGLMDADLFIDLVDIEWGQRARSKGYENFGCFSARMQHAIGEEPIWFLGTAYAAHSTLRHYYQFRNAVLLYRMNHIPRDWKWRDAYRLTLRFFFYALFSRPRLKHLGMMCRGIWHGLRGRTGKYEQACGKA